MAAPLRASVMSTLRGTIAERVVVVAAAPVAVEVEVEYGVPEEPIKY